MEETEKTGYKCCGKSTDDDGSFFIQCDDCDEWVHGDCVNLKESFAQYIEKYYCHMCQVKDPSLKIVFTESYKKMSDKRKPAGADEIISQRCGQCLTCRHLAEGKGCKTCKYCAESRPLLCLALQCMLPPEATIKKPGRRRKSNISGGGDKRKKKRIEGPKITVATKSRSGRIINIVKTLPQCLGVDCSKEARADSKYCSDECGFSLARANAPIIQVTELQNNDRNQG